MEIVPDPYHVLLLALPFAVATLGLHLIIWRPLLNWLEERESLTTEAEQQAKDLDQSVQDQLVKIEERLAKAHHDAGVTRQEARARAQIREAEIIGAARSKAEEHVDQAVSRIRAEQHAAGQSLQAMATDLSDQIASRVLGRSVSGPHPEAGA